MVNARAHALELIETDIVGPVVPSAAILSANRTRYARYGKRLLDVSVSAVALLLLLPIIALIAIAVRIKLGPGGVIFRQERVGMDGVPFTIYKFRSMLPDRRVSDGPYIGIERRRIHKSDHDPRHTPFGKMLRASSMDELPQLFNVLKGDMSLVGPRPELVSVATRDGFLRHPRHLARPGITGSFQVSELRSRNRIAAGLHLDVAYVADIRVRSDLAIMARTVAVLAAPSR